MTRDEGREISRVSQHLPQCVWVCGGAGGQGIPIHLY